MKCHKLTFKNDTNAVSSELIPVYRIVFDGNETDYLFDGVALKASSEKDGIYPVVVCDCEIIGCGGMYVFSRIDGEEIIWEKFWSGQCIGEPSEEDFLIKFSLISNSVRGKDLVITAPIRFRLDEYTALANKLVEISRRH